MFDAQLQGLLQFDVQIKYMVFRTFREIYARGPFD